MRTLTHTHTHVHVRAVSLPYTCPHTLFRPPFPPFPPPPAFQNWAYDKPTLYSFAKHYETGRPPGCCAWAARPHQPSAPRGRGGGASSPCCMRAARGCSPPLPPAPIACLHRLTCTAQASPCPRSCTSGSRPPRTTAPAPRRCGRCTLHAWTWSSTRATSQVSGASREGAREVRIHVEVCIHVVGCVWAGKRGCLCSGLCWVWKVVGV